MSSEARQYWQAGQDAVRKGEMQKGLMLLQRATQADSGFAQGWLSLGLAMCKVSLHDKAAYCFAMAAANSEDHESVGPVAKTNLDVICKQRDLWPSELRSRMTDTTYAKWLRDVLPPTTDDTLTVLVEGVGTDTQILKRKIDVATSRSVIMQLIEQNVHAMNASDGDDDDDDISFTTEVPSQTTTAVIGSGLFPMLERTLLRKCVDSIPPTATIIPSKVVLKCCLIESQPLWDLNQVDTNKLQKDSSIDAAPLQGRLVRLNRPVQRHLVEHKVLSDVMQLAENDIRSTSDSHITSAVTATAAGTCCGLLIWECLSHNDVTFDAGGFSDTQAHTHKWQYLLYSSTQFTVSEGDEISVTVDVQDTLKSRATFTSTTTKNTYTHTDTIVGGTEKLLPPYHASMLNDTERTVVYRDGLKLLSTKCDRKKPVMDLGSGTGLLSLMASVVGFENVYAVERFEEMASIAAALLSVNEGNHNGVIHNVNKHSSDITIPDDIPEPVSVLVHEIFGTDPLSEGLIPAFNSCVKANLFSDQTLFCPSSFRVYACAGGSDSLRRVAGCNVVGNDVQIPPFITPRKLEQNIDAFEDVTFFTDAAVVWEQSLSHSSCIPTSGTRKLSFPLKDGVIADSAPLVFYWFDFTCGESVYSTRHSTNHWVQNIEILPEPIALNQTSNSFELQMQWQVDRILFLPLP